MQESSATLSAPLCREKPLWWDWAWPSKHDKAVFRIPRCFVANITASHCFRFQPLTCHALLNGKSWVFITVLAFLQLSSCYIFRFSWFLMMTAFFASEAWSFVSEFIKRHRNLCSFAYHVLQIFKLNILPNELLFSLTMRLQESDLQ